MKTLRRKVAYHRMTNLLNNYKKLKQNRQLRPSAHRGKLPIGNAMVGESPSAKHGLPSFLD
ncbi:MAG: hypothetical protein LBG58_11395 [Planctomycetaceae bacterium]|nr:hypothetical protein [Planctomycetaceae bacterium]